MRNKNILFFFGMIMFGTLMLMATTSSLSNTFQVYAEDNCDTTSTCTNTPGSDTQRNNCNRSSICANEEVGGG
jgi:hypothetical protein